VSRINVFVSYDRDHDEDLYDRLVEQSASASYGFAVSGCSASIRAGASDEQLRRRIREADEVIFICGEHTEESTTVGDELRIAREEQTPFFMLWGRREAMCTKPVGARPSEGIYGWSSQMLQDQITLTLRKAAWDTKAAARRERA